MSNIERYVAISICEMVEVWRSLPCFASTYFSTSGCEAAAHPIRNPGQKIFENVSKEAWKMWVEHMKMLMNEYRLNLGTAQAQEFLIEQMDKYFFGEGAALPPDFVPPRSKG